MESRREGSRLVVVVMKEGLSKESGQRGRCREEETPAARSRREGIFEHGRRNMQGGNEERVLDSTGHR